MVFHGSFMKQRSGRNLQYIMGTFHVQVQKETVFVFCLTEVYVDGLRHHGPPECFITALTDASTCAGLMAPGVICL